MHRLVRTILATALTSSTLAASALVVAPAQAAEGYFTWDGTWRTNMSWGDVTSKSSVSALSQTTMIDFRVETTTGFKQALLKAGDKGAYGSWEEYQYQAFPQAPVRTSSGGMRLVPDAGGLTMTGSLNSSADPVGQAFTATCIAGPCLNNTTSPVVNDPPPPDPTKMAPETTIIRGLENVRKPARSKYTFSVGKAVQATFQCRLNKQAWKTCTSPYVLKTKRIRTGKQILRVRAVSSAGVDRSPAKKYITVR